MEYFASFSCFNWDHLKDKALTKALCMECILVDHTLSAKQLDILKDGLEKQVPIEPIINSKISAEKMDMLLYALKMNINISGINIESIDFSALLDILIQRKNKLL